MRSLKWAVVAGLLVSSAGFAAGTAEAALMCAGKVVTIKGTNKGETINGTNGPDVIHGLGGNDNIRGRGGNDTICAGVGNDNVWGGTGKDRLYGGRGNDVLKGGPGVDAMFGHAGRDIIDGGQNGGLAKGGSWRDACYNATEPDGSGCDRDQVNDSDATNYEFSDLLDINEVYGGLSTSWLNNPQSNGKTFRRSIGCFNSRGWAADNGEYCAYEFNLSRDYRRFAARIGQSDFGNTGAIAKFEVIGDGSVIKSQTVAFGQVRTIKADVRGILRLELRITMLNSPPDSPAVSLRWLDPRIAANDRLYPANGI